MAHDDLIFFPESDRIKGAGSAEPSPLLCECLDSYREEQKRKACIPARKFLGEVEIVDGEKVNADCGKDREPTGWWERNWKPVSATMAVLQPVLYVDGDRLRVHPVSVAVPAGDGHPEASTKRCKP